MLPLIRMTWTINRRLLFQFSPVLALYLGQLVLAQCTPNPMLFAFLILAISGIVTAIITLQGLTLPVEGFILSLPISRTQVVQAKYVTSLLGLAAGLALPLLTALITHWVAPVRTQALSSDVLGVVALSGPFFALGIFYFLPFIYHLGPSNGLMAVTLTLVIFPSVALAWKGASVCLDALLNFGNAILNHPPMAVAFGVSVVLCGFASLRLSVWCYRRRAL